MGSRSQQSILAQSCRIPAESRQTQIRRRVLIPSNPGLRMYVFTMSRKLVFATLCTAMLPFSTASAQQATEIQISYSKGLFPPRGGRPPAEKPVLFRIRNLEGKAME